MTWFNEMLDKTACDQMLDILLQQTLNDRIPRYLHGRHPRGAQEAPSTDPDDSGIIYAGKNSHVIVSLFAWWDAAHSCRIAS